MHVAAPSTAAVHAVSRLHAGAAPLHEIHRRVDAAYRPGRQARRSIATDLIRGAAPLGSPTRALARRCAGALRCVARSRGSLATSLGPRPSTPRHAPPRAAAPARLSPRGSPARLARDAVGAAPRTPPTRALAPLCRRARSRGSLARLARDAAVGCARIPRHALSRAAAPARLVRSLARLARDAVGCAARIPDTRSRAPLCRRAPVARVRPRDLFATPLGAAPPDFPTRFSRAAVPARPFAWLARAARSRRCGLRPRTLPNAPSAWSARSRRSCVFEIASQPS